MISVNISTIKQYFWYYENLNKEPNEEQKIVLPVLKIKDIHYIFNSKHLKMFNEEVLELFITYDKHYSYLTFQPNTSEEKINLQFSNYDCLYVHVDESLKWSVVKNPKFSTNNFYNELTTESEIISFSTNVKKKSSVDVFMDQINTLQIETINNFNNLQNSNIPKKITHTHHTVLYDQYEQLDLPEQLSNTKSAKTSSVDLYHMVMGDEVELNSGVETPFWEDCVFIDSTNPADF